MSVGVVGTFDKARLLTGVSLTALMLACCISSPAWAGTYPVNSDAALRAAIQTANADSDANATIVMTGSFSLSPTALPNPTKPIVIDTNGFILTNTYDPAAGTSRGTLTIQQSVGANVPVTFSGTLAAANAGAAATTSGQVGAVVTATAFTNDGSIRGGNGGGGGGVAASGGAGMRVLTGSSLTNNGTIVGGDSTSSGGGQGVTYGNTIGGPNTILNIGTIRGGNGLTGGTGILAQGATAGQIVNSGTIEGGTGAAAIMASNGIINLDIVNSGTIRAGAGQANAISRSLAATTGTLTLELQPGSVIEGNVVAGVVPTTDVLRLDGTGSDSFDISAIGAAQQYRNFDTFEKTGRSTWLLTGVGTATTNWTIYDGTLLIGDHSAASSVIGDITNFGTLGGSGTIFGDVTSSGTVAPGNSIGTLTISGNYTGNGGTLAIESVLGGDASPTDRLVVTGNTAGTTNVRVTNLGGGGAQTLEGIKIVDVGGSSTGSFSLLGDYVSQGDQAVVGGAYAYRLYQNGISTPADGDWYLRSALIDPAGVVTGPVYQPGVPLYEAYPQLLLALNGLSTLQQRLGDRYWHGDSAAASAKGPDNVWLRTEGTHAGIEPDSGTTVDSYDYNLFKLEGGLDGELYQDQAGRLIGGLTVHYCTISGDIGSIYGNGDIDTSGFGLGATLTWYGDNGFYVDAQSQVTWYDSDLKSDLVDGAMESGNNGFGYALSLETGRRFAASGPWSITPQAQLIYSSVDFDTFNDRFGARVSLDEGDSLVGRLGVALDREETMQRADGQTALAKIYGISNLYGEFLDGTTVDVSGTGFETKNDPVWAGLTLGGSYTWNDDRYSLYGEVAAKSSLKDFGDSYALSGTAGLRVKW
ncbi:autotransporter family protein [Rhizobium redzepovicii]|uniref:autotransporter family protein n=1 Tax=Rhizobium redzepovicii TaxID=2867518 RepID=UPI0028726A47|nr:autotransporter outer membrane beta-barrel domain-containing protein [Rhizobium redzepovicii]MDR9781158.1 autotransporter outer membrane beta-barrel domain-containing protein [Rhizobium redzepovicii]